MNENSCSQETHGERGPCHGTCPSAFEWDDWVWPRHTAQIDRSPTGNYIIAQGRGIGRAPWVGKRNATANPERVSRWTLVTDSNL